MGSFFGKGKDKSKTDKVEKSSGRVPGAAPASSSDTNRIAGGSPTRASRRVVTGGSSAPKPGAAGAPPSTKRVIPAPPGSRSPSVMAKPRHPEVSDESQLGLPTLDQKRPERGPITASDAPKFAGTIEAGRNAGPSRSGDQALIAFMVDKAKLLSSDQAATAKAKADKDGIPLDAAIVALNFTTEDALVNALTQECWVPHLKVDKYEIRKKALDTISREDAVHFGVFPVDKLGSLLTLAMINPLDQDSIRILESKTSLDIKRVVATRSEINQGIEKYYSGKVEAKDTSISFTAEPAQETKSIDQLMAGVTSAAAPTPSAALVEHVNITPEIQDIDDLLTADDVIAPAIIEPLKFDDPLVVPVGDVIEIAEPQIIDDSPALVARAPEPVAKPTPKITAPEFEIDNGDELSPVITKSVPKPAPKPAAPVARPATASISRPITANVSRGSGSVSRPTGSSTGLFPARIGTGRTANPKIVNLIPVLEEEFQHAITHGKAHVFEKWVGLQSRNRIINAVQVDAEFDTLLTGLYGN